jgi:hypothetical protein
MNVYKWKKLFLGKGVYNIVSIIFVWMFTRTVLRWLGLDDTYNNLFLQLFLFQAFIFGIGFILVGFEVRENHIIILTGALAMFSLAGVAFVTWWRGTAGNLILVPGFIDFICASLFAFFWWSYEWEPDRALKE